MKRLLRHRLTATLLAFALLTGAGAAVIAAEEDLGYWDKFKMLFIDWDDDAKPGTAKTEVAGVRGLKVEKALGSKGYDWQAVKFMEDYPVSMDDEKQFLQEGQLGPFKAKGGR